MVYDYCFMARYDLLIQSFICMHFFNIYTTFRMVYGYCFIARSLWFVYYKFYMYGFSLYIYTAFRMVCDFVL